MSDPIWLAIIGGLFTVVMGYLTLSAPARLAKLQNDATAKALEIANARSDKMAAEARADTEAVRVQAEKAAELLVESNTSRAAQAKKTDAALAGMHLLINSLYTAAKEGELRAVELTLTTLRILHQKEPSPELLAKITDTEAERDRLKSELEERAAAAKFAAEKHEV